MRKLIDAVSRDAETCSFVALAPEQAALLEWSPNPTLVLDCTFRIRYVNRAALAYGQVERDALIGQNVWECYPSLKGSIFHQAYESVLTTRTPFRFERYDHEHDRWQLVYAFPAEGGVVAVLEDITERRRAERFSRPPAREVGGPYYTQSCISYYRDFERFGPSTAASRVLEYSRDSSLEAERTFRRVVAGGAAQAAHS